MRDLFSQCTRTCVSVMLRNVNLRSRACRGPRGHVHRLGEYRIPSLAMGDRRTALLDNGGQVGQRGWSSATYAFCRVEY